MSDDVESKPAFEAFRLLCPNCSGGVCHRSRMGVRDGQAGTGHVAETCPDCKGAGWLPLGNGEWKGHRPH
ncbi:hypothetical protein ACWCXH_19675 [Kitasatospora sp. NPDC001660]